MHHSIGRYSSLQSACGNCSKGTLPGAEFWPRFSSSHGVQHRTRGEAAAAGGATLAHRDNQVRPHGLSMAGMVGSSLTRQLDSML